MYKPCSTQKKQHNWQLQCKNSVSAADRLCAWNYTFCRSKVKVRNWHFDDFHFFEVLDRKSICASIFKAIKPYLIPIREYNQLYKRNWKCICHVQRKKQRNWHLQCKNSVSAADTLCAWNYLYILPFKSKSA